MDKNADLVEQKLLKVVPNKFKVDILHGLTYMVDILV